MCPPTTKTRPSPSVVCAEQNRSLLSPTGLGVREPVAGSQICGLGSPALILSHVSTRPSVKRLTWMETKGHVKRPDHTPVCAGLPGLALLKVTLTPAAVPKLPALSHAYAEMVWLPLPSCFESNVIE